MRMSGLIVMLATIGCASSPELSSTSSASTSRITAASGAVATLSMVADVQPGIEALAVPADVAWKEVLGAYADLGIPVTIIVNEAMLAGNQGFNTRRELAGVPLRKYFMCGEASGGPNADTYMISMNIATQIQKESDGTSKAATVLDANATSMVSGTNSVHCASSGALEERVNDQVAKRLHLK